MVLLRDVSEEVRVPGESQLSAAVVLHAETGLVLGVSLGPTEDIALAGAFDRALTLPAAELPPAPPSRVVFLLDTGDAVRLAVKTAGLEPELIEAGQMLEAEEVFDGLLGHLSGRAQPDEPPSADEWIVLVQASRAFALACPWERWSDAVHVRVDLEIEGTAASYVAVVMGASGIQHGLAVYRGKVLPADLSLEPGRAPDGTLLLFLDARHEVPAVFAQKALRYGWPADDALHPAWIASDADGPHDLGADDAAALTVVVQAVLALDRQRLAPVDAGPLAGQVGLADGRVASYAIHRPAR